MMPEAQEGTSHLRKTFDRDFVHLFLPPDGPAAVSSFLTLQKRPGIVGCLSVSFSALGASVNPFSFIQFDLAIGANRVLIPPWSASPAVI